MLDLALSMYVLEVTGSAALFAAFLAAAMVPTILLAPLGGVLADRGNPKAMMVGLDLSSLRIKKQGEVKNFCRSHPAGPRRIGLAQSSGKSTLPTKE